MITFLSLILLFAFVLSLAYWRLSAWVWSPLMLLFLGGMTYLQVMAWPVMIISWLVFIPIALIFNLSPLRKKLLSGPTLKFFRNVMPTMSSTERDAIDAGDVWWDGDLFSGRPDWKRFLEIDKPKLSKSEQAFIDNQTETLCSMLNEWDIVHEQKEISKPIWDYIKKEGFLGMAVPKEYGGLGFSPLAQSSVVTKIASRSVSVGVSVMVPNSLGPAELLSAYGTEKQKKHYLPRLASGQEIPCFALTAPDAGSDAASMTDEGIVCKGEFEGKEIIGIRLNWNKRYITLAPISTVLGLAFKLKDPDGLIGKQKDIGITLCLIPTAHRGVESSDTHSPLGMAFSNGPIRGKDVFIPLDWIIGGPEMAGKGWRMLMEALSAGRSISLPAISTACAQLSYRMTGAYARLRKQFNLPIGKFEGVAEALARIGGTTYMLEASRTITASAVGQGIKPAVVSAIVKYHMTEMSRVVLNEAMDIHGGRGIQLGPRNYLGLSFQSIPISITVEGANILTRSLMIFGQGAVRCHPYVRDEIDAAEDKDHKRGLKKFDRLLFSHIGHTLSNFARTLFLGLSAGRLKSAPVQNETAKYYRQLTRMSSALALVTDVAMLVLGGNLKRRESLSARLGDVLSHLYLASTVLKYFEDNGCKKDDLPYVHWALRSNLHKIQYSFDEFFRNFPVRSLARIMSFIVFPYGRHFNPPKDVYTFQIADHMMQPSELRDRITGLCYVGKAADDPTGRIERVFLKIQDCAEAETKLNNAIKKGKIPKDVSITEKVELSIKAKVLTKQEGVALVELEKLIEDAEKVDEFDSEHFSGKKHQSQQRNTESSEKVVSI